MIFEPNGFVILLRVFLGVLTSPSKESVGASVHTTAVNSVSFSCFLQCSSEHSSLWENPVYTFKILCFFRPFQTTRFLMRGSDGHAGPVCSSNLSH